MKNGYFLGIRYFWKSYDAEGRCKAEGYGDTEVEIDSKMIIKEVEGMSPGKEITDVVYFLRKEEVEETES